MGSHCPSSAAFAVIDLLVRFATHVVLHRIWDWIPKPSFRFIRRRRSRTTRLRRPALTASMTQTDTASNNDGENTYMRRLSEAVNSMRQKSSLTDATIICNSKQFKAHRDVLAKFSPFFESALTKGWKETNSIQIDLPTVSPHSMEAILSYMYTHTLTKIAIDDKAAMMKLLQDADYLQMDDLVEVCFKNLSDDHLTTDKFCDFCQFVEEMNNEKCLDSLAAYLAKNFGAITKSDEFWLLTPGMMRKILLHPHLRKSAMSYVVASLLRWVENENDRRADFLVDFFNILDTWCPDCLTDTINKYSSSNASCNLGYRLPSLAAIQLKDMKRISRNTLGEEKLMCLKLLHEDDCQHVVTMFDTENNAWLESKEIPFKLCRIEAAVSSYGHHIFFFGGEHMTHAKRNPASRVTEYCPFTNSVVASELNLVSPVCRAGAGLLRDTFYMVNGVDVEGRRVKTVQCYSPKSHTCWPVASTNCGHWMPSVFPFNDSLYAIGSLREDDKFLERYDRFADQWTMIADIPNPYCGCKATLCGSQLFVLKNAPFDGNFDESQESRFHVYDLSSKLWTEREFKDGPEDYPWCLLSTKKGDGYFIFAVSNDGRIQMYGVETGEWRTPLEPPAGSSWFISYFFVM